MNKLGMLVKLGAVLIMLLHAPTVSAENQLDAMLAQNNTGNCNNNIGGDTNSAINNNCPTYNLGPPPYTVRLISERLEDRSSCWG
jgi:hypothetical protein